MNNTLRPDRVEGVGSKRQIYYVDQFHWFPEGLEKGSVPRNVKRRSAVSFIFPGTSNILDNRLSLAELLVLGYDTQLEAYFLSKNSAGNQTIQKIFDYGRFDCRKNKVRNNKIVDLDSVPFPNVFTTQETPFLYRGEAVSEFSREYYFNLFGLEFFTVKAQRKEPSKFDYMEIEYIPDYRDGKPVTLARIVVDGKRWTLSDEK